MRTQWLAGMALLAANIGCLQDAAPRGTTGGIASCKPDSGFNFCADFETDPYNCGGCGITCDSGVC